MRHRGTRPGPLLLQVTRHGLGLEERLSGGAVRLRLKRRAEAPGIAHFSAYDLRRTYVSTLLEHGSDISTVANMPGHRNAQTTSR